VHVDAVLRAIPVLCIVGEETQAELRKRVSSVRDSGK
jgi:hypothetical protein